MRASLLLLLLASPAFAQSPSGDAKPVDPYPDQPAPSQQAPSQAPAQTPSQAPSQQAPAQQSPSQQAPAQQSPSQQAPAQQAPSQQAPSQAPAPSTSGPSDASPPSAQTDEPAGPPPPSTATTPTPAPVPTGPHLTKLTQEDVPDPCKPLGKDANSPSLNRSLSARISLASCIADQKMKPLVLCDCEQSIHDIDVATRLSLTLLDEVYVMGDPATKILARQAKGDLISGLVQRMETTVPPPRDGSEQAMALRNTRLDMLQPLLDPWRTDAKSAYTDVDKLAKANPQLAKNPAVVAAVRSSRAHLSANTGSETATAKR